MRSTRWNKTYTKAVAAVTASAAALTLGVCASSASANTSDGWVRG